MDNMNRQSIISRIPAGKHDARGRWNGRRLRDLFWKIGPFFRGYFIIIFVLLLVQLSYAGTQTFSSWDFAGEGDAVYEINDDQDAEMLMTVGEDHLCGAVVEGFLNELNLIFTDEKLIMTVADAQTGGILTESVFMAVNQPQSAADGTGMYFAFEDDIPKGTKVRVRLHSEGFTNRGVFFELSDRALNENVTILNGEVSEQTLCLNFKHKVYGTDPLRPLLFFLLEAALGVFLLLLHRRYGFPLRIRRSGDKAVTAGRKKFSLPGIAATAAATLLCMVLLAEFADWTAVSRVSDRYDADMVCRDDYNLSTRIAVRDDTVVEQVIRTDKRNFRGIGLAVQNNSDDEDSSESTFYVSAKEKERLKDVSDTVKYVDGTLLLKVYENDTDELVAEGEYEVGYLSDITRVLAPGVKSSQVNSTGDSFVWLDFGKNVENSGGRDYRIEISAKGTGENGVRLSSSNRTNTVLTLNGDEKKTSLCMVTLFDVNGRVSSWYYMLIRGMIIMVLAIGILIRIFSVRIEYMFLVSILCMGFLFSLIVPPYCVPDERTHVDTIYRLSNRFLGIKDIPGPSRIYKRNCDVDASINNTMSLAAYMYCEMSEKLFEAAGPDTELVPAYARNAVDNVTVLNYLPGAVGFTIGRLLGRNILTMIMLARWCNIAAVSWIMFLAVRKVPFGKGVFAIIGLLPKMLNQNVSCSYDGMLIAGAYLFLAYALHLLFEERVSVSDLLTVILSAWFLACNKGGVYTPLLGLLLLLPFLRKKRKSLWFRISCNAVLSVVLVFSFKFIVRITGILSRSSGSALKAEGQSVLYTLSDFYTDPGNLARVFEKTAIVKGQNLLGDMFGIEIAQQQVNAPWVIIIAFVILLLIASMTKEGEDVYFSFRYRVFIWLFTAAGTGMICVSMLLSWTEKGSESIGGLQGRYFLPYMILPFLCMQSVKIIRKVADDQMLIWAADILLFITFCNLIISTFSCGVIGTAIT